jgi:hypothetical protein
MNQLLTDLFHMREERYGAEMLHTPSTILLIF